MARTQPPSKDGKTAVLILKSIVSFSPNVQLEHSTRIASLQKHCIEQSVHLNHVMELLGLLVASDFNQQLAEEQYGQEALAILSWLIAEIGITKKLTLVQCASLRQRFEEAKIDSIAALTLIDKIIAQQRAKKNQQSTSIIQTNP